MNPCKWAALALFGWCAASTVVAVFTGKFIDGWRDACADHAARNMPRYQQFDVEPRYVEAEIPGLETAFAAAPYDQERP